MKLEHLRDKNIMLDNIKNIVAGTLNQIVNDSDDIDCIR